MQSSVWLVHWTGQSIIVCAGSYAYLVQGPIENPFEITPDQTWLLSQGTFIPVHHSLVDHEQWEEIRPTVGAAINRVGRFWSQRMKDFPALTAWYDDEEFRRQMPCSVPVLQQHLRTLSQATV